MLRWALVFLVAAVIAGLFGLLWIVGVAATIAKSLFGVFLFICLLLFVAGIVAARKIG